MFDYCIPDDLLPRILDIAEYSPDRKAKVAACELLHSLVIVMIGNSQSHVYEKTASRASLV